MHIKIKSKKSIFVLKSIKNAEGQNPLDNVNTHSEKA